MEKSFISVHFSLFSVRSTLRWMNTIPKMEIAITIPLEFHSRIPEFGREKGAIVFEAVYFFSDSRYDRSPHHTHKDLLNTHILKS